MPTIVIIPNATAHLVKAREGSSNAIYRGGIGKGFGELNHGVILTAIPFNENPYFRVYAEIISGTPHGADAPNS